MHLVAFFLLLLVRCPLDTGQILADLPIICLEAETVISRKTYKQEAILDDGQWLRPLIAGAADKTQSQPDAGAVARIREVVLYRIERGSVSLVA